MCWLACVGFAFTDDRNHPETRTSDATVAAAAAPQDEPVNESVIWTSTLTVQRWGHSSNRLFDFDDLLGKGNLEPAGLTHDGVETLLFQKQTKELHFMTYSDLAAGSYVLYLDGKSFQFEASGTEDTFSISKPGLEWRNGDEVEVRLTLAD